MACKDHSITTNDSGAISREGEGQVDLEMILLVDINNHMEGDPDLWQKVSEDASRARSSLKKKQQAITSSTLLDAGENTWSKIRRLAIQEPDIQMAVKHVRDTSYWRMTNGRPDRSSKLYPVTGD